MDQILEAVEAVEGCDSAHRSSSSQQLRFAFSIFPHNTCVWPPVAEMPNNVAQTVTTINQSQGRCSRPVDRDPGLAREQPYSRVYIFEHARGFLRFLFPQMQRRCCGPEIAIKTGFVILVHPMIF
jgi:hypothetical protein